VSRCVDLAISEPSETLLVVELPTPLKNLSQLGYVGMMTFPTEWKVIGKSYSKPPTRSNELVMSYKFRGKHLHFFEWFPVHSWILIWNASPVDGDIWYLGLPLYVFVASENALFLSGWCHCFGFGIFLMPSIFPFLMVCIFGLHHGPIPSFGDIFRQSNSQILNYGIVM